MEGVGFAQPGIHQDVGEVGEAGGPSVRATDGDQPVDRVLCERRQPRDVEQRGGRGDVGQSTEHGGRIGRDREEHRRHDGYRGDERDQGEVGAARDREDARINAGQLDRRGCSYRHAQEREEFGYSGDSR